MDQTQPPPPYTTHDPHPRPSVPETSPASSLAQAQPRNSRAASSLPGGNEGKIREDVKRGEKDCGRAKDSGEDKRDSSLGLALYEAVSQRNERDVHMLLQNIADTNVRPPGSKPALTKAVAHNDIRIVRMLLERGKPDLEGCPSGNKTALYTAVADGHTDIVRLLLQHGANANWKPSGGQPAIYKAYVNGYRGILWMLLDSAHIQLDDTPPGGSTVLYQAAEKGDTEVLRALLRGGAAVDIKPPGGVTAMHRAAVRGDIATTQMLLQCDAEIDLTPPGGTTALWHATKNGDAEMVRLLLRYGADISAKPPGGQDVVTLAVKKDKSLDRAILNMLLESKRLRES